MSQEKSFTTFAELAANDPEAFLAIMSRQAAAFTNAGVVKVGMVIDYSDMQVPAVLSSATATATERATAFGSLMEAILKYEVSKGTTKLSSPQTTVLGKVIATGQKPEVLMLRGKSSGEGLFPLSMLGKSPKTLFKTGTEVTPFSDLDMAQLCLFLCGKKFKVTEANKDTDVVAGQANGVNYYSKWYVLEQQ